MNLKTKNSYCARYGYYTFLRHVELKIEIKRTFISRFLWMKAWTEVNHKLNWLELSNRTVTSEIARFHWTCYYSYFLSQPPRPFIFFSSWCLDFRKWHWTPCLFSISVRKLALICVFLAEYLGFGLQDTGQSGHFHHHRWLGIPLCVWMLGG